jgi:hypothetical protein
VEFKAKKPTLNCADVMDAALQSIAQLASQLFFALVHPTIFWPMY